MEVEFFEAKSKEEIKNVFDYNLGAFSDSPDFDWNFEGILKEIKMGWKLFSVKKDDEIIAAAFYKIEKKTLLTKNTAIKMNYQGYGFSHKIKDFFEEVAKEEKITIIKHYCRVDNFRTYSLNESHGYRKKTVNQDIGSDYIVEWEKKIK